MRQMPAESYPRYSRRSSPCSSRSFAVLEPTYPMIPHTRQPLWPPYSGSRPDPPALGLDARFVPCRPFKKQARPASAELSQHESLDPSTQSPGNLEGFGLGEDADHGLGPRGAHEHAASLAQLVVQCLDLLPHL